MEFPPKPPAAGDGQSPSDDAEVLLERLIVEFFSRSEQGAPNALEMLCSEHPDFAKRLRGKLAALGDLGLLDDQPLVAAAQPSWFGDYRIQRKLGSGGMGIVYLAEQQEPKRLLALKVVRGIHEQSVVDRFRREAQTLASVEHPGIVRVLTSGMVDDALFLAMEWVPGEGLDERLERQAGSSQAVAIGEHVRHVRDLARALSAVHAAGFVHRDIKPSNVRITPEEKVVLVDFGLVHDLDISHFSQTGVFLGTPHYAAPEQVAGKQREIGPATDIYGLGATLYECLTSSVPFAAATTEAVFYQILSKPVCSPRVLNPQVSRDLETVVMKAMEKLPRNRYGSAAEFAEDLDAVIGLRAIRAKPPGWGRRSKRLVQRHPVLSAALSTALLVLLGFWSVDRLSQERDKVQRERASLQALVSARKQLERYRERLASSRELQERVDFQMVQLNRGYFEPGQDRQLNSEEAVVQLLESERELAFADVRDELRRAEELGSHVRESRELRAELDLLQLIDAAKSGRDRVVAFYRARLQNLADTQAAKAAALTRAELTIRTGTQAMQLYVYRCDLQSHWVDGGEPRMVPLIAPGTELNYKPGAIPVQQAAVQESGFRALELCENAGQLRAGNLLIKLAGRNIQGAVFVAKGAGSVEAFDSLESIDGHVVQSIDDARWLSRTLPTDDVSAQGLSLRSFEFARGSTRYTLEAQGLGALGLELITPLELAQRGAPATIWTGEGGKEIDLPAGLSWRLTASPAPRWEPALVGRALEHRVLLDPGTYLLLLAEPGLATLRLAIKLSPGEQHELTIDPLRAESLPTGFVPFYSGNKRLRLMQEHEVTCAQYLAYLNDPEVLNRLNQSAGTELIPRQALADGWRSLWPRSPSGSVELPAGTHPQHPVSSISWNDARAYADWYTQSLQRQGFQLTCSLPNHSDWHSAANPVGGEWRFVFGPYFRPKWPHSNFAHRQPAVGRVMTHPVDRSSAGIYDLAGGVMEWSAGWYWEEKGWRTYRCGAWPYADPKRFEVQFAQGELATFTSSALGFRLVAY